MILKIIKIDTEKCNGCGLCVNACHEGAIALLDGKAKLVRDNYCDGLGNCLPVCPTSAIGFEEREAAAYNANEQKETVKVNSQLNNESQICCCPSNEPKKRSIKWPIQIKLVPINASHFNDADLLISADCVAYACDDFHQKYMKDRIILIGCPKLDDIDYTEKLSEIIAQNNIKSVTVVRMEVPCCAGIERAVSAAVKSSGKDIPINVFTLPLF